MSVDRDELREAIARALAVSDGNGNDWDRPDEVLRSDYRMNADALLDGPLASLIASVKRLEELAVLMDRDPWHKLRGDDIADRIRVALGRNRP
jgi:hypothetical protein